MRAYKMIDKHTLVLTGKKDGKTTLTGRIVDQRVNTKMPSHAQTREGIFHSKLLMPLLKAN